MRRKTLMLNSMLALGAVAIVGFGITSLGAEGSETPTETLTEVQTGTVAQTVSATGNAVTPQDLTLNFSAGGELVELGVAVGDTVTQGQVLAKVEQLGGRERAADGAGEPRVRTGAPAGNPRSADRAGRDQEPGLGRPGPGRRRHRADEPRERPRHSGPGHGHAAERSRPGAAGARERRSGRRYRTGESTERSRSGPTEPERCGGAVACRRRGERGERRQRLCGGLDPRR